MIWPEDLSMSTFDFHVGRITPPLPNSASSVSSSDTVHVTFNQDLQSWNYSWKSSRWTRDDFHCFHVALYKRSPSNDCHLSWSDRSPQFKILSSHKVSATSKLPQLSKVSSSVFVANNLYESDDIDKGKPTTFNILSESIKIPLISDVPDDTDCSSTTSYLSLGYFAQESPLVNPCSYIFDVVMNLKSKTAQNTF